jgi:hypothetical protein
MVLLVSKMPLELFISDPLFEEAVARLQIAFPVGFLPDAEAEDSLQIDGRISWKLRYR